MSAAQGFRYNYNAPYELVGQAVADRYVVRTLAKRGAVASVFVADDVRTGRQMALKVSSIAALVRRTGDHVADIVEQFEQVAWHARRLRSEHTVALHDFGRTSSFLYVVAELLAGENLKAVLAREGRLDPLRALRFASHLVASLQEAHGLGWTHGDLRPANVFVHREPRGGEVAMVLDHGIAQLMATPLAVQLTADARACGTPDYMSPEQCLGEAPSPQSDFYAVGIMLYEMLVGSVPFRGRSQLWVMQQQVNTPAPRVSEVNPRLARYPAIDAIVDVCLAKAPEERFGSARRLLSAIDTAIEEYLGGRATPA